MLLIGYLSDLSCRAGSSVDVHVSSSTPDVVVDLVRLIHGDENPDGPGFLHEEVDLVPAVRVTCSEQDTAIGSYAVGARPLDLGAETTVRVDLWPTTPDLEREQGVLVVGDLALTVAAGHLVLRVGDRVLARSASPLIERRWHRVEARVGAGSSTLAIAGESEPVRTPVRFRGVETVTGPGARASGGVPLLAAVGIEDRAGRRFPVGLLNGKIAAPEVHVDGTVVAAWALEQEMSGQTGRDTGGAGHDLDLVNVPTRAMTGPGWTGRLHAWEQDPAQWNAIHFHDDDLADARWPVSHVLDVPAELPSGAYGVRLRAEGQVTDYIPFAVRPAVGAPHARVALMLGTWTYVAYANEHLTEGDFEQPSVIPVQRGSWEDLVAEHPEWGKSVYDLHSDGSGVAYSTALRPIPNLRPTYRFWGFHAPRRFPADLYVVHFLTRLGEDFDVITEHDLHRDPDLLAPYQTVITGSHPEYYSGDMLDALDAHVDGGGGLLYLGGDGFYWVTTSVPDAPLVIEVRKSEGLRHWDAAPGERHHSTTGEPGGIWRSRGRSPHQLFGVGMGGFGWDDKAPGYRRTPESFDAAVSWVFDGVEEEVIGDFGLIMNGTSGDEIDRVDHRYGTPLDTVVLASSEPHSEWYVPVPEDIPSTSNQLNATFNPDVRSDMVLIERDGGGAVFSVGSIIFTGALPVNGGDNNVARVVENVVRNFTARGR